MTNESAAVAELAPVTGADHLLKVAHSVTRDAQGTWADLWEQFRPYVTPGNVIDPELQKQFTPECGWEQFLENLWLLKHYLDSIGRICARKH